MSKKTKNQSSNLNKEYELKTDAVERLAKANKGNVKKISDEELAKYQKPFLPKVPRWAKAAFIKWWFAGAVCYFFFWGLGTVIPNQLDLIFVLWLAMGFSTDLLTNNVFRFIQMDKEYEPYIMVPGKKYITLILNVLYALVLMMGTIMIYEIINAVIINIGHLSADSVPLGVEPIMFGLFYTALDFLAIYIKHLLIKLFKR